MGGALDRSAATVPQYARDHADIERAQQQFARAEQLAAQHGADSAGAMKAAERGWKLLRGVLERHPWRPKRVRRKRPSR